MHPKARPHRLRVLIVASMMMTAQGCGDGPDLAHLNEMGEATGEASGAVLPSTEGSTDEHGDEVAPSLGDAYAPGLQKEDNGLTVALSLSTPEPKYVGKYTWTLTLSAPAFGETPPVPWADVIATPTMPAHGHGTFPLTTLASRVSEGVYELHEMDLFMAGLWQVDIAVTWEDPHGRYEEFQESQVTFEFDLDG